MKSILQRAAACGVAVIALLVAGCAHTGPGPGYGVGVGYAGYGPYDGPYYGGYGPYYGDSVIVGGYRHAGYYGSHHFYGGGYAGRSVPFGHGNGGRATGAGIRTQSAGGPVGGGHPGGGGAGGGHR